MTGACGLFDVGVLHRHPGRVFKADDASPEVAGVKRDDLFKHLALQCAFQFGADGFGHPVGIVNGAHLRLPADTALPAQHFVIQVPGIFNPFGAEDPRHLGQPHDIRQNAHARICKCGLQAQHQHHRDKAERADHHRS